MPLPCKSTRVSEKELADEVRKGDVEAFERLLKSYQRHILRLVLSILKDLMDAEEVTQDVFLTVRSKIDQFRGEASLSSWLYRIAVNAAFMHQRRTQNRRYENLGIDCSPVERTGPEGCVRCAAERAGWSGPVEDSVLKQEAQRVIEEAANHLEGKYYIVFRLKDMEGVPTEGIARMLGLGVPAVKTRLHRARLFLRNELAEYFDRVDGAYQGQEWIPARKAER